MSLMQLDDYQAKIEYDAEWDMFRGSGFLWTYP